MVYIRRLAHWEIAVVGKWIQGELKPGTHCKGSFTLASTSTCFLICFRCFGAAFLKLGRCLVCVDISYLQNLHNKVKLNKSLSNASGASSFVMDFLLEALKTH